MRKKIAVLGSTGSIGTQTLDVLRYFKNNFEVIGLAAGENICLLSKQIQEFKPKIVSVKNEKKAQELRQILAEQVSKGQVSAKIEPQICFGTDGLRDIATYDEVEIVVVSVSGTEVLIPTLEAIKKQKIICLATKEILVMAGKIIMQEAQKHGTKILPVDS
ncbi:MAG: 1-deoxy-D-xylulose-5-phosphate reductoisomerase, partial [Thermosediminibacterales bacterium]|nr:1-deoxy-D-xylulose-5-phosphate reductoisomerase [Thermosediminibacterales bacterium]